MTWIDAVFITVIVLLLLLVLASHSGVLAVLKGMFK